MSRAFVKEDDGSRPEILPEHPISAAPNLVTARGLRLIDARIAELRAQIAAGPDEVHLARHRRDLRYWDARHATARLTHPDTTLDTVQFASRVTYATEDGTEHTIKLTGEDEANPTDGCVAYTAPVARALMGLGVGDTAVVTLRGEPNEIEVIAIDLTPDEGC